MKNIPHVRKQYNRFSFRLSILGKYVDAGESYEDEQMAGCAADLAKTYLRNQFAIDLESSLSGEQFSALAYSRRRVDVSNSYELERALAPGVRSFIKQNLEALQKIKDAARPETMAGKLRRSWNFNNQPEVREWVEKVERAELEAEAFSALNQVYFFSLLDASSNRLTDVLKPLRLAIKMHAGVTDSALVARADKLAALVLHLEQNLEYVKDLTANLRAEEASVRSAVANLEAARPQLN